MKVAVLSDIHDNVWNLKKVLQSIKKENCEAIIFCGDFCAPFSAEILVKTGLPIWAVFGNNDGDKYSIADLEYKNLEKVHLYDRGIFEIKIGGRKIAIHHYKNTVGALAKTGRYDAVFYGHTHQKSIERFGKTIFANPGGICGIFQGRPYPAAFAIYDTKKNTLKFIKIE